MSDRLRFIEMLFQPRWVEDRDLIAADILWLCHELRQARAAIGDAHQWLLASDLPVPTELLDQLADIRGLKDLSKEAKP